ncbi:hypothetical protein EV189_2598 [Motilibacter rhizosphaerae]|uniref:Uncharacterized protein n=1 Tax=Motilibacter rhizosphaerae TaxID=598652 RepID=A0A4Q7NPF3_9ACTN|nr:hypothetical protein [Motilibacter rhizosphaerae]RZS87174.1 hypothetical protein EV189_2598 [Motilibacter rhizosphaerae]
MTPLLWDAIPVVAVALAIVLVALSRRTRRPEGTEETVRRHARFREALRTASGERPGPPAAGA